MRYKEAYELLEAGLQKAELGFPVLEALKAEYFDKAVNAIGLRNVKKIELETFSSGASEYVFTNTNYSKHVIKVEYDEGRMPFVPIEAGVYDEDNYSIGYWLKTDRSAGNIEAQLSPSSPTVISSASHGLDTGDYVIFSEIDGFLPANGISTMNGVRYPVVVSSSSLFTIQLDSTVYSSHTTGTGLWVEDTHKIYFNKNTSHAVNVYYLALPEPRNSITSRIDLPSLLIDAAIFTTLADFLLLDGQLQKGAGYKGLARSKENEYKETYPNREPYQDILPSPLGEFIKG